MQPYPHHYGVSTSAGPDGPVTFSSPGLPDLEAASPPEFGGPGGHWSPETLLMAAVANCLALTWRSVATHSKFPWNDLRVEVSGVLDRVDRVAQFTELAAVLHLTVPPGTDAAAAERLAHKTESACLVSNSLKATTSIELRLSHA